MKNTYTDTDTHAQTQKQLSYHKHVYDQTNTLNMFNAINWKGEEITMVRYIFLRRGYNHICN